MSKDLIIFKNKKNLASALFFLLLCVKIKTEVIVKAVIIIVMAFLGFLNFSLFAESEDIYLWKERHVSRGYTRAHLQQVSKENSQCQVVYSETPGFYFSGVVDNYFGRQPFETLLTRSRGRSKYGRRRLADGSLISFSKKESLNIGKLKYVPFQVESKNSFEEVSLLPFREALKLYENASNTSDSKNKKPFPKHKKCYGRFCQQTFLWGASVKRPEDSVFQITQLYEGVEGFEKIMKFSDRYLRIHYSDLHKGFKQLKCCRSEKCLSYSVFDVYKTMVSQGLKDKVAELGLAPGHVLTINNISYQCLSKSCQVSSELSKVQEELKSNLNTELERRFTPFSTSNQAIKMMTHSVLNAGERRPRGDCLNYVKEGLLGGGYINYHIGWNLKKDAALCSPKVCRYKSLLSASYFGPWLKIMKFKDILKDGELKKFVRSPYDVPYGCVTVYKGHFYKRCKGKGKKKHCWQQASDKNAKHGHIEIRHMPVWYENLSSIWATERVKTQGFCRDKVKSGSDQCCEEARKIKTKSCRYKKVKTKKKSKKVKRVKVCSSHFIYKRRCFTDGFVSDFKRPYARHDWRSKCYKNRFPDRENSTSCQNYTSATSENKFYSGDNRPFIEVYCKKPDYD